MNEIEIAQMKDKVFYSFRDFIESDNAIANTIKIDEDEWSADVWCDWYKAWYWCRLTTRGVKKGSWRKNL